MTQKMYSFELQGYNQGNDGPVDVLNVRLVAPDLDEAKLRANDIVMRANWVPSGIVQLEPEVAAVWIDAYEE